MRRLVVEFSGKELEKALEGTLLEKVKSFEMLHILKMVPYEMAAIVRFEVKGPPVKIEDFFPMQHLQKIETELLAQEKEGVYTYFFKIKLKKTSHSAEINPFEFMPYLSAPTEFKDGKLRMTVLGEPKQIRKHLENLKQSNFHYKVISLMDARFPPDSPVARLTEKQREVLIAAYKLGYYDLPRRISSEQLAKKFGLVKSTFVAHRRKAERHLLKEMLSEF